MSYGLIRPIAVLAMAVLGAVTAFGEGSASSAEASTVSPALAAAVAAPTRDTTNRARDQYRHPAETLAFFGVRPSDTVVEIWPSSGWYTEILAPYLAADGKLIVAPPKLGEARIRKLLDSNGAVYGKVAVANFPGARFGGTVPVAEGSADVVLTFRNVHNWRMGSLDPNVADYSEAAFRELYAMLKPGGVLGIEDHRLDEAADAEHERKSGYVKVSTVRALAEKAGFKFAGASEINANSKDTKDYPEGVWSLPPVLNEGETNRAKYLAIGESDRMTLKFVRPLE